MKRLIVMAIILWSCAAFAETNVVNEMYVLDLTISGTTTQKNSEATYSGLSMFSIDGGGMVLDLSKYKLPGRIFSFQLYRIDLALSNPDNETLTTSADSGATITVYYIPSNVNSYSLWAGSGVTAITSTLALSGSTPVPLEFDPEHVRFLQIGAQTGVSQFSTIKAKLIMQ